MPSTNIEQKYWDEHNKTSCQSRCMSEFCLHPYTILEVNGRIIDVQKSFAPQPWFLSAIPKVLAFVVTIDCLIRDVLFYNGEELYFYMAYAENWCLALSLLYLAMSTFSSLWFLPKQPVPGEEGVQFHIGLTWSLYPIAVITSGVNILFYWIFIADSNDGAVSEFDYFAILKNGGILLLLIIEGQIVNRIPIRWSHLIWAELVLCIYMGWTFVHGMFIDIGNPEISETSDGNEPIYGILNWTNQDLCFQTALGWLVVLTGVAPAVFFALYVLSLPCRRHLPLPEKQASSVKHRPSRKDGTQKGRSKLYKMDIV